jgi:hypothetical protein
VLALGGASCRGIGDGVARADGLGVTVGFGVAGIAGVIAPPPPPLE